MIPGDAEKVVQLVQKPIKELFVASPGALVYNSSTRKMFRIGTITPKYEHEKCIFLMPDGKCQVHAVAPYGCAFFDIHMDMSEGQKRSMWGLRLIQGDLQYNRLRDDLPFTAVGSSVSNLR
jgi:hypothetical protein